MGGIYFYRIFAHPKLLIIDFNLMFFHQVLINSFSQKLFISFGVVPLARSDEQSKQWEFSVSIRDSEQARGIGSSLLAHAAQQAKKKGVDRVYGHILESNIPMVNYTKHRGSQLVRDYPGIYRFHLTTEAMTKI